MMDERGFMSVEKDKRKKQKKKKKMKEWYKELGKTFLIMSLPVYGLILWALLFVMPYWYAWFFTNLAYTPIIYGINRFVVFRKRIKTDVGM